MAEIPKLKMPLRARVKWISETPAKKGSSEMAHIPVYPKTCLCPGTPGHTFRQGPNVLFIPLSPSHEGQAHRGGPEAASSTQASSPKGIFFFWMEALVGHMYLATYGQYCCIGHQSY